MKLNDGLKLILTAMLSITFLISGASFAAPATTKMLTVTNSSSAPETFTPAQKKSIEKVVHDYLLSHPELLLQVSIKLREKMQQQQQQQAMQAIEENKQALFNNNSSPIAGNPQGSKLLVEFFDYQCPHCKAMDTAIQTLVKNNKDLKVIFKEWPIFGGASLTAARAALAANKQGKYYQFHDALLAVENPLNDNKIFEVATTVGLNITELKKDMSSPEVNRQIKDNFALARKLNLVGTPAFILTNSAQSTFTFIPGETTAQNLQKTLNGL